MSLLSFIASGISFKIGSWLKTLSYHFAFSSLVEFDIY
jgi:hypothetical protein